MSRTLTSSAVGLALAASLWAAAACSPRTPPTPTSGARSPAESTVTTTAAAAPAPSVQPAHGTTPDSIRPAPARGSASDSGFVQYDAATKTVTFRLVAGPFTFDGFSSGGGTLTVPPGSNNVWNFVQDDGTPHSAELASGSGPLPSSGGDPAIPRAYTNKVVEGLPQGATDVIRFTAPDSGTFRIRCGVPGHALSGMWLWLKVDPAAKVPAFGKS